MSIPKNKINALKNSFKKKEEDKENKKNGKKSSTSQTIFFKPLDNSKNEKKAKFELLLFTPSFTIPHRAEQLAVSELNNISFGVEHHNITIGKKYYSIPCKKQSIPYSFVSKEKEYCPICNAGYQKKRVYWDKVNKLKEEYNGWENIPADEKAELKFEKDIWYRIINKYKNEYIAGIFIKRKNDDTYEIVDGVRWWKAPNSVLSNLNQLAENDVYAYAEDYDDDGNIQYGNEYKPSYIFQLKVDSTKSATDYYNCASFPNPDYILNRKDESTIVVKSANKGIDAEIKIPDIYEFFENMFSNWEENTAFNSFKSDFSLNENDSASSSDFNNKEFEETISNESTSEDAGEFSDDDEIPEKEEEKKEETAKPGRKKKNQESPF